MKWNEELDRVILSKALLKDGMHILESTDIVFELSHKGQPNKRTIRRHIDRLVRDNFLMIRYSVIIFVTVLGAKKAVAEA